MNKWYDYYIRGLDKERFFSQDLIKQEGGEVIKSNKKSDIYDHIDLVWIKDFKNITFDVKAAKKSQRSDLYPDYNIHWIELKNVKGNPGWLFGKSDYIAFECKDFWLCVDRKNLISILKNHQNMGIIVMDIIATVMSKMNIRSNLWLIYISTFYLM